MSSKPLSPSAFHYQPSSPLETLVRRTSAKRANGLNIRTQTASSPSAGTYYDEQHSGYQHEGPGQTTPPRQTQGHHHQHQPMAPPSPLLHSGFARDSIVTTDDANSYLDMSMDSHTPRDSVDSKNVYQEGVGFKYYEESVYSTDTAIRDSWKSTNTVQQSLDNSSERHLSRGPPLNIQVSHHSPRRQQTNDSAVPTVVITEYEYSDSERSPVQNSPIDGIRLKQAGSTPVIQPMTNFSRPMRPSAVPVLMPAEEEKQKVLERNATRPRRQQPTQGYEAPYTPSSPQLPSPYTPTNPGDYFNPPGTASSRNYNPQQYSQPRSQSPYSPAPDGYPASSRSNTPNGQHLHSSSREYFEPPHSSHSTGRSSPSMAHSYPSPSSSRPTSPEYLQQQQHRQRNTSQPTLASPTPSYPSTPNFSQTQGSSPSRKVTLSRKPPSIRAGSPVSLYSTYSYYNLDSPLPSPSASPNGSTFNVETEKRPQHKKNASSSPLSAVMNSNSSEPQTKAHHFLQLGIQHHEANNLRESAIYFEKSAKEDGGCGAGMLMYGLTLRHGWGCQKDEKVGFKWLRNAAESAVVDLESARNGGGIDNGAVRAELILAIYEVGQCFFHGWGVSKDQKMAVSYYRVAARLGDADAQTDLGFCLANGKGCKKDRKEAAKWYRDAVAQGASDIGLAWIYKEKFQ